MGRGGGQQALADMQDRLRQAIEASYARVRRHFAHLVREPAVAEDLTQEVFARFWEACLARGEPQDAGAYIGGVEKMVFLEYLRSKARVTRMTAVYAQSPPDPASPSCETAEREETFRILRGLLGQLDPDDQWLIAGRHFFEMTGDELCKLSRISRRTLVDKYKEAMEKLRLLAVQNGVSL
jgi:RNA polymerase sigma factor (sigma-70 family)